MRIAFFVRGWIVVRDDYHAPSSQCFCVYVPPLAGAHRIARREQTETFESVNVLLAFTDENYVARTLEQLGESIKHESDALEVPVPSAIAVWSPLLKVLGIVANGLV